MSQFCHQKVPGSFLRLHRVIDVASQPGYYGLTLDKLIWFILLSLASPFTRADDSCDRDLRRADRLIRLGLEDVSDLNQFWSEIPVAKLQQALIPPKYQMKSFEPMFRPARTQVMKRETNQGSPFDYYTSTHKIRFLRRTMADVYRLSWNSNRHSLRNGVAHEYGHHIQKILGLWDYLDRLNDRHPYSPSVLELYFRLELQADCLAGIYIRSLNFDRDERFYALFALSLIGTYSDSENTRASVRKTLSHGTAARRREWFLRGFNSGKLERCDSFTPRLEEITDG